MPSSSPKIQSVIPAAIPAAIRGNAGAETRVGIAGLLPLATAVLTASKPGAGVATAAQDRDVSIWEITTWILPMAPEHLRRVLAQTPGLPQGRTGTEGGTRWFSLADVAALRAHFAGVGARTGGRTGSRTSGRGKVYRPHRPPGARAPLIAMAGPQGRVGRSTGLLHLACAAALAGYRVLVLDADPAGILARQLGARQLETRQLEAGPAAPVATILPLIAGSCGIHLRQVNARRLDRGEPPLPLDEMMAAALDSPAAALIRPTAWPGLDIIAAAPDLALADLLITGWRTALRSWHPARALAEAVDRDDLRQRYDLILCDTGAGLGPLVMAVLTAADVLLVPTGLDTGDGTGDGAPVADGLTTLVRALRMQDAEATMTARALGHPAPQFGWRRVCALPVGAPLSGGDMGAGLSGPVRQLPPLPVVPQIGAGQVAHLYALDYRDTGKLVYGPLRSACDATWHSLAAVLSGLWAEDGAALAADPP